MFVLNIYLEVKIILVEPLSFSSGSNSQLDELREDVQSFLHGDWDGVNKGWQAHRPNLVKKISEKFTKLATKSAKKYSQNLKQCPEKISQENGEIYDHRYVNV